MRKLLDNLPLVMAALLMSACGPAQNDPGPGGVTVGEAKALDEAAEMLDERNAILMEETEPNPASASPASNSHVVQP